MTHPQSNLLATHLASIATELRRIANALEKAQSGHLSLDALADKPEDDPAPDSPTASNLK